VIRVILHTHRFTIGRLGINEGSIDEVIFNIYGLEIAKCEGNVNGWVIDRSP
jgi:hypothetical protein